MAEDIYDRIIRISSTIASIMAIVYAAYIAISYIQEGQVVLGIILGASIIGIYAAISKGIQWLESINEYLENQFKLYPSLRRLIIAIPLVSSWVLIYLVTTNINSITYKIFIWAYFGILLPPALISLIRDDRAFEKSPLAKHTTREAFRQDPSAVIAYAFTHLESQLKKKLEADPNKDLALAISQAYGGPKSKLVLEIDGKDYTPQMRDLLAGAFTLFRNPRHHNVVKDDEFTANAIYSFAGLLINLVNASETRLNSPSENN